MRLTAMLATAILAAIALRLSLPSLLKSYVNASLAEMGPYTGRVADIDVALLRGAYTLNDLRIVKRDAGREIPFLDLESMDISLEWRALFSGELVGEIFASQPTLNLIRAETSEESQPGSDVNWSDEVRELFPFNFNRVEVVDGKATFLAPGIEANEALTVSAIRLQLQNLTNIYETEDETPATIDLTGQFMDLAPLHLTGDFDPNQSVPTFDIDFSIEGAPVTSANPWLREFLNVDAESGEFFMYLEAAAADGRFEGYLKPIMQDRARREVVSGCTRR
jgi:hypothetical protein